MKRRPHIRTPLEQMRHVLRQQESLNGNPALPLQKVRLCRRGNLYSLYRFVDGSTRLIRVLNFTENVFSDDNRFTSDGLTMGVDRFNQEYTRVE